MYAMTTQTADQSSNVTKLREAASSGPRLTARATFSFQNDTADLSPEIPIIAPSMAGIADSEPQKGEDLSGKKKVIFFIGRGKTGKTTLIRWICETALSSGSVFLMADMDPTNDTFSKYIDGVARPDDAGEPALAVKFLERLLQHALEQKMSLAVDMGGGDTTLRSFFKQLPDLVALFESAGFAVVLVFTVGPQEEDLSPLATMAALGFHGTVTAIVLNEGLVEVGETRLTAFDRTMRHSAFKAALTRGAVAVWMPKLLPAASVEIRRLQFRDAVEGRTGMGTTPLGPFDRTRVSIWLRNMEANFSGIRTWLP
jgi:hypothetical protein